MGEPTPSAVTDASTTWEFQNSYVERLMDHAALTAAHPDDTLILAGPPRYLKSESQTIYEKLLPVGMVQQMQVTCQKPTVPAMAIGSGRGFYLSGKAQGTASVARLFMNGRNLLRVLMTNAVASGIDVTLFDDKAANKSDSKFFTNLDSELFLMPFGMAVLFRDKIHNDLGAFYLELCMINTWSLAVGAGQNMIMENVNILFDRVQPMDIGGAGQKSTDNYDPKDPQNSELFKAIFQGTPITDIPSAIDGEDTVPTSNS